MNVSDLKLGQYVRISGFTTENLAGYNNGDVLRVIAIAYHGGNIKMPFMLFKSNCKASNDYASKVKLSFTVSLSEDAAIIGKHNCVPNGYCTFSLDFASPCKKPIGLFNGDLIRESISGGFSCKDFIGYDKLCYMEEKGKDLLFSSAANQALLEKSHNGIKIGDLVKFNPESIRFLANHPTEERQLKSGDVVKVAGFGEVVGLDVILYDMLNRKVDGIEKFSCGITGGSRSNFNMIYTKYVEKYDTPKETVDLSKVTEREKKFDEHMDNIIKTMGLRSENLDYVKSFEIRSFSKSEQEFDELVKKAAKKCETLGLMSKDGAKETIKNLVNSIERGVENLKIQHLGIQTSHPYHTAGFLRKILPESLKQGGAATTEKSTIATDQKLALTPKNQSDSIGSTLGEVRSRQFSFPFFGSLDMKNLTKVGMGAGAALLLGLSIFGTDLFSYIGTGAGLVKDAAKDSVPIQFEIDRAKSVVAKLVPDIKTNMLAIAQEEVELTKINDEIKTRTAALEVAKTEMLTLRNDLKTTTNVNFTYGGKTFTRSRVEADLASRLERYQVNEASLGSLNKVASIRQNSLASAKQKLSAMLDQKRQLEVELESLASRLKLVDLAKTTSNYNFDDSSLSHAKQVVASLSSRLEVEEKLANVEGSGGEVPLKEDALLHANIADRVSEYLGGEEAKKPAEVATK